MASFNKKFLEEFIECYKNEPALWQSKNDIYKDKSQRNKSWEKLLIKYKEIDKDAKIDLVKKKISGIRSSYKRELHKVRISEKSGAGTEDVYEPSLWYYKNLHFLRDQEIIIDGVTTFDDVSDETEIASTSTSTKKKPKITESDFLQKAVEHLDHYNKPEARDDADIFAEGWATIFRKLHPEQKIYAKHIIDEALMKGQLGRLEYSSANNLGRQQKFVMPVHTPFSHAQQKSSSSSSSLIELPLLSPQSPVSSAQFSPAGSNYGRVMSNDEEFYISKYDE